MGVNYYRPSILIVVTSQPGSVVMAPKNYTLGAHVRRPIPITHKVPLLPEIGLFSISTAARWVAAFFLVFLQHSPSIDHS
jgi:hypothetical protein